MYTETGMTIRRARIKKGFTQISLAKKMRVSSAFINKIENGRGNLPAKRVTRICKLLRLSRTKLVWALARDFSESIK